MAYRIIDRVNINYQPSVYNTASYPGINTQGGSTTIINDIAQIFNIFSGTTNTEIGALPAPKIVLDDKYYWQNFNNYFEVDYFDPTTNDVGGQMEFLKNVKINTNDFTQDFLDNNYVYLEMLIYKRRNDRKIFATATTTFAWGSNVYGQLGDATNTDRLTGVTIQTFSKVSAGGTHSLALDGNTIWAFGDNQYGQLGDGSNFDSTFPIAITNNFKEISAGLGHSLAIDNNGDIWAWGYNFNGQLGDGTTTDSNIPIQITGLTTTFQKISAGNLHSLALDVSGNVWAWGDNNGKFGNNLLTDSTVPIQITGLTTSFIDISANGNQSIILDINGNVWVTGDNNFGQLGLGDTTDRIVFTQVTGLTTSFKQVKAGDSFTLLLDNDGFVWSCGSNVTGELGNGTNISANTFNQIFGGIRFKKIDTGKGTTLISGGLDIENQLWFWGENQYGQFGIGNTTNSTVPIKINDSYQYTDFSIGAGHVLANIQYKTQSVTTKWKKSAYVVPSPHYVTTNYQYPTWGSSFWTRSGTHYIYSAATYQIVNIDRPNHRRVENVNELMDVTDFYNGRFFETSILYRNTTGGTSSYSTVVPYENGAKKIRNGLSNRYSYSPQYNSLYSVFRYIIFDPNANQGRGQIYSGPLSKIVRITHQYQPFIDDYHANALIGLPTAYVNPNHNKYKFLPRIENKLP